MAAFTHIGFPSRFCDESFGVYYAADSRQAAIKETVFHRQRFYSASNEPACKITMREYVAKVSKPLIDITKEDYGHLLNSNPEKYKTSQEFGKKIRDAKEWGIYYPSMRNKQSYCVAIFRPPALTIPIQSAHLEYFWDGQSIVSVKKVNSLSF